MESADLLVALSHSSRIALSGAGLYMIVASRVLLLSRLGKEHPDLPAELFYSPEELAVLVGSWGRKGDGHPGAKLLAEGLQVLQTLVWYKRALDQAASEPRRPRKSPT